MRKVLFHKRLWCAHILRTYTILCNHDFLATLFAVGKKVVCLYNVPYLQKKTYPKRADLAGSGVSLLVQKYCFFSIYANILQRKCDFYAFLRNFAMLKNKY